MIIPKYFALLLVIFVNYSLAQWQNCNGRSWRPSCTLRGSVGHGGRGCPSPATMWYYDRNARQCRPMVYQGCGGNDNRWCSFRECNLRCRR